MFIDVIAFCDTFYGRPICPEQNGPAVSVQTCGGLRPNYGSVHFCQYCIYVNVVAILQQKAHFSASLDEKLGMGFCSGLPQRAALIFVNIPSSLSPSLGRNRPDQCHPKNRGVPPGCWGEPILGWETQARFGSGSLGHRNSWSSPSIQFQNQSVRSPLNVILPNKTVSKTWGPWCPPWSMSGARLAHGDWGCCPPLSHK